MRKRRIPDSALQIAALALRDALPSLTKETLRDALNNQLRTPSGEGATEPDRLVSASEGARMLGVSRRTFDRLANIGRIHRVRLTQGHRRGDGREIGGSVRFRLSDVQRIVVNGLAT